MGCDIHSRAERLNKETNSWEKIGNVFTNSYDNNLKIDSPFYNRDYSLFGFLADVRNYDYCEPIIPDNRGFPKNVSKGLEEFIEDYKDYGHSASYLTLKELLDFDYDKTFWNRRVTRQTSPNCFNGACKAEEGEGEIISYRNNLGEFYFKILDELKTLGEPEDIRIIFWFDN